MLPAAAKLFVLDTNVILHDANCINNFGKADIVLPISVLEELDHFKRGNENIHFQAREFLRLLDSLTGSLLAEEGTSRGPGLGNVRVMIGGPPHEEFQKAFMRDLPDHRILQCAWKLQRQEQRIVVVVSMDYLSDMFLTQYAWNKHKRQEREVIAAADELGLAMVFTGMRHFRH